MTAVLDSVDPPAAAAVRSAGEHPGRGRTTVTSRALSRVTAVVAAEALGIAPRSVHVDLSDQDGLLAIRVSAPARIPALARMRDDPSLVAHGGGTLLERAAKARTTIGDRVTELTGTVVARVAVDLTGVEIGEGRRVR